MLHRLALRSSQSQGPLRQQSNRFLRLPSLACPASARPPLVGTLLSQRFGVQGDGLHGNKSNFGVQALISPQKRCFAEASSPKNQADQTKGDADQETKADAGMLAKLSGVGFFVSTGVIGYGSWLAINNALKLVGTVYASPHIVAYAGFWFGFSSATMCAALAVGVYRLTFIRPEGALKDSLNIVRNNEVVKATLGETLRDAGLKSYEIKGGGFSATGKWSPHKIQMMYLVHGDKGLGLVTTVCVKHPSLLPRALNPNLLSVDFLDENKDTLLIVGDKSMLEVRDNIHRLLDLKLGKGSSN